MAAFMILMVGSAAAENFEVSIVGTRFNPSTLTIQPGDSVTWSSLASSVGVHNVAADDGSFRCAMGCDNEGGDGDPGRGWTFTRTFNDPGVISYNCEPHAQFGMRGKIIVTTQGTPPPPPPAFAINFGITGSWADVDNKPGARQGFSLEVVPASPAKGGAPGLLNAYWFTYAKGAPGSVNTERWFNALGEIQGNQAVMDAIQCSGGVFDDPAMAQCVPVGTITAAFTSCTEGTINYELDLTGGAAPETTGGFPIKRVTPDVLCENLAAGAAR